MVAGGGTLTLSRNWAVTLIGSPSFSHTYATSVRVWLTNIAPDATPRKIRNSRNGIAPVATSVRSVIAQALHAASCHAQSRANSTSGAGRTNFGLILRPE